MQKVFIETRMMIIRSPNLRITKTDHHQLFVEMNARNNKMGKGSFS